MKASIVVMLFCMFTGSNARSSNCPTPEWFVAEFVGICDKAIPSPITLHDSDLTYLRDVMLFTEEEIAQVEEDAIQFFKTRYGLDFSQSEPDEWGQRFYQNGTFFPARFTPEIQYVITFNRWIVSGNTRSVCFETHIGSFRVDFSGEQILYGTYGGEKGIPVVPGDAVLYGFYNIQVHPQEPLVILLSTTTPIRIDPYDGFGIINCDLFHRVWGRGLVQGLIQYAKTEDGRNYFSTHEVFTFPAHPTFIP